MEYSSGSDSKLSKGNISLDKRSRIDSSEGSDDSPNRVTKKQKSILNENFNKNDLELSGEESELELNKNKKSPPKPHVNSRPKRTVKSRPSERIQESDDSEISEDKSDSDFDVDYVSKPKKTNPGPIVKRNIKGKASKKSSKQLNKDNSDSSDNESLPELKETHLKDKDSGNSEGETLENARDMFSHSKSQKNLNNVASIKNHEEHDTSSDSELSDGAVETNKLVREEEQTRTNDESKHRVGAKTPSIGEELSDGKDTLSSADRSANKPDKTVKNQPNQLDSNSILKYLKSTDSDSAEEGSNKLGSGDSTENKDSDKERLTQAQYGVKKTEQKKAKAHSELEDDSDEEMAPKKQNSLKKTQQKKAKAHSELEDDSDEELTPRKQSRVDKTPQTKTKATKLSQRKTKTSSAKPRMARSSSVSDEVSGSGGHNARKMKSPSPLSSDEGLRLTEGTHDISPSDSDEEETQGMKPKRPETKNSTASTREKKMRSLDSEEGSSSDDEKESSAKKTRDTRNKNPHKQPAVIRHKRYLAAAGLRVQNYSKLWENCNSDKARVAAMLALLTKNGLSGRPTIDKCVQLRNRRETKQEIQELDLDNILQSGRGGRRTRGAAQSPPKRATFEPSDESAEEDKKQRFARIKALADSDSDN